MCVVHLLLSKLCSVAAVLCALLAGHPWWGVVGSYALGVLLGLLLGMLAGLKPDLPETLLHPL
jgi:ABC-type uncharacterized transport system permease subunit